MSSTPAPSRWTIPLGAVLVHLGIGSVYAWSTLNRPIIAALPPLPWWGSPPYTTFTAALVLLGLSAAVWGTWVERRGARVAARVSALCFATGLVTGGLAIVLRQPWLLFVGLGLLCGVGCGLGYIAPVSTLVKWFPDRRGLATGLAIMGFGGGAFLAGHANAFLLERVGVAGTLFTLGGVYLLLMLAGAQLLRPAPVRAPVPDGAPIRTPSTHASIVTEGLTRREAVRTPQFALLWGMLCINVTAGIGILAQASPMMQDLFGRTPAQAAGIVFLADLFGTANVGAIHGALLTAWSVAAVIGPLIITELSSRARAALAPGGDKTHLYDLPLQLLAALLAIGLLLTVLVKPLVRSRREYSTTNAAANAQPS